MMLVSLICACFSKTSQKPAKNQQAEPYWLHILFTINYKTSFPSSIRGIRAESGTSCGAGKMAELAKGQEFHKAWLYNLSQKEPPALQKKVWPSELHLTWSFEK